MAAVQELPFQAGKEIANVVGSFGIFQALLSEGSGRAKTEFARRHILKRTDLTEEDFLEGFEYQLYRKLADLGQTTREHRLLPPLCYQFRKERISEYVDLLFSRASRGDLSRIALKTKQKDAIGEVGALTHQDTLQVLKDIGTAFDFLHSPEVSYLHRDLRPWNIVGDEDGFYLMDFGISLPSHPPFFYDRQAYYDFVIWLLGRLAPRDIPDHATLRRVVVEIYGSSVYELLETFKNENNLSFSKFGQELSRLL